MKIVLVLSIIMSILLTPSVAKGVSGGTKASTGSGRNGTPTTTWTPLPRRPRTTTNNSSSSTSSVGWSSDEFMNSVHNSRILEKMETSCRERNFPLLAIHNAQYIVEDNHSTYNNLALGYQSYDKNHSSTA
ncbi:hypothetical protein H5410_016483 [Solanum commersonii]|uniref:SCP domain-containing protein n=1 Tax=Solanum commersonii TaxID=4109 RepID=A0A9J5ZX45_SOLCO|nr:hypothetical protein H5410_016483 [Solanum commersonii]